MRVQFIAAFIATVFAGVAFSSPVPAAEPTDVAYGVGVPCGCTNDCIIACGDKPDCICPKFCDPKYACPTTTTVKPTPSPTPSFPPGKSCGCWNHCTLYGCGPDIPKERCFCPLYCDPFYACPQTTTPPVNGTSTYPPTPTFTCGCTNPCKIACGGRPGCICPQYCDPKYECKTAT